jgi:hypothetical protein
MREVRTDPEIVSHAVVDGINAFVREVLEPRCPALRELSGAQQEEMLRLKYEIAAAVAANWAVSWANDEG